MAIILTRHGKAATKLDRTIIEDESFLQRYIMENPDVLPLDQLDQNIRAVVLLREFPTPSGPIDALATDQDGNLYLIETKLYKNPDKRLVLAQMLDYGAALWKAYPDPGDFIVRLDALMRERTGKDLTTRVRESYGLEGERASDFVASLKSTVESGRFRFVVLMDAVEDRLKNLISYVNANSTFDILGIGLDFYHHDDLDILIPTLHGGEAKKQVGTGSVAPRRTWDEQSFFADAAGRVPPESLQALKILHEWVRANADELSYGKGAKSGSFGPKFSAISKRTIFTAYSNGTIELNFGWLKGPESGSWRDAFGAALIQNGFKLPKDFAERYVNWSPSEWTTKVEQFMRVLSDLLPRPRGTE